MKSTPGSAHRGRGLKKKEICRPALAPLGRRGDEGGGGVVSLRRLTVVERCAADKEGKETPRRGNDRGQCNACRFGFPVGWHDARSMRFGQQRQSPSGPQPQLQSHSSAFRSLQLPTSHTAIGKGRPLGPLQVHLNRKSAFHATGSSFLPYTTVFCTTMDSNQDSGGTSVSPLSYLVHAT